MKGQARRILKNKKRISETGWTYSWYHDRKDKYSWNDRRWKLEYWRRKSWLTDYKLSFNNRMFKTIQAPSIYRNNEIIKSINHWLLENVLNNRNVLPRNKMRTSGRNLVRWSNVIACCTYVIINFHYQAYSYLDWMMIC